jgi:hypothetical protein
LSTVNLHLEKLTQGYMYLQVISKPSDETVNSRTMVSFVGLVWSPFLIDTRFLSGIWQGVVLKRKDTEKARVTRRLNYVIETSQPLSIH